MKLKADNVDPGGSESACRVPHTMMAPAKKIDLMTELEKENVTARIYLFILGPTAEHPKKTKSQLLGKMDPQKSRKARYLEKRPPKARYLENDPPKNHQKPGTWKNENQKDRYLEK